jgi:ethanolamine utilization protein EutQ (cupin superfamily)
VLYILSERNTDKGEQEMKVIKKPAIIKAHGKPPKTIEEFIGAANSGTGDVSIARMKSPRGWSEPGQITEFDEYTVVLKGSVKVSTKEKTVLLKAGQSVIMPGGTWVRYSTPQGAEYISVCIPAFTPDTVRRDE